MQYRSEAVDIRGSDACAGNAIKYPARFYLFRCWPLSSVTLKRRKSWLLAASALASSSLGISEPALAQNECGVLVGGVATCTSTGNPFNSGITYAQTVAGDLTVNLQQGVNVTGNRRLGD
jgi:hypothetical protein